MLFHMFLNQNFKLMIATILLLLSCVLLGIFLGAQITEAVLLVPYWKTMEANDFFELHQTYGKKIHQFFAPLTIAATIIPIMSAGYIALFQGKGMILLVLMGFSVLAFFSTFFLYFKEANRSFADRSLSNDNLLAELIRWERWHWGRIVFEFVAFGCSLLLLITYS